MARQRHHFNGSSLLCFGLASLVPWQKNGVIFHITAHPLPDTSKMDKINIHTATKNWAPQNQCHLFDQRLLPKARADCTRMSFQCDLAGLHPDSGMWNKRPLGHPWPFLCLPIPLVSGPSGHCGLSDGSEPKWLWHGNSHQIPWQLPQQPPLILPPCHTRKEITEWI